MTDGDGSAGQDTGWIGGDRFEQLARDAMSELVPGYDATAMALCFNLIRMANRMTKDLEVSVHRPDGLSFAAYRILFAIRSAGPLNPNELARLSSVSTASISSVLNTLERYGLTQRAPDPRDGRKALVELTAAGTSRLEKLTQLNSAREVEWSQGLTTIESQVLAELLRKLLNHHPPTPDKVRASKLTPTDAPARSTEPVQPRSGSFPEEDAT